MQLANTDLGSFVAQILLLTSIGWGSTSLLQVSNLLPTIISQFKNFGAVVSLVAEGSGSLGEILAVAGNGASALSGAFSSALPVILAVSVAIAAIVAIAPKVSDWYKELTGDTEYLTERIEEANEQIKTNKERLEELNSVPFNNRTYQIQQEIDALKEENEELQKSIDNWAKKEAKSNVRDLRSNYSSFVATEYEVLGTGGRTIQATGDMAKDLKAAQELVDSLGYSYSVTEEHLKGLNGTWLTAEEAVSKNIEKYKEYLNKIENGNTLTADERKEFTQLGNSLTNYGKGMQSASQYTDILTETEKGLIEQIEALGLFSEDTANKAYGLSVSLDGVTYSASGVAVSITEAATGMSINNEQAQLLLNTYPELNNVLTESNGIWSLNTELLLENASAGEQTAIETIKWMKTRAEETVKVIEAEVQAEKAKLELLGYGTEAYKEQSKNYWATYRELYKAKELISSIDIALAKKEPEKIQNFNQKTTESSIDPIKEQSNLFKEELSILEDQLFFLQKAGATEEEQISHIKKMQDIVHSQAEWFRANGIQENNEYLRELGKQWWEYEDQIQEIYKNQEEAAKEAAEQAKKSWEDSLQNQISALEEKSSAYEQLFSYVASQIEKEISILEEKREIEESEWDAKINALEKENEELENQIELEKLQDALAKARQSKVMVYKNGKFQYVEDIDVISEAQSNLESFEREEALRQETENLKKLKEEALNSIDEQIAGWEEYKESWSSVVDNYEEEQDRLLIQEQIGIDLEGELWKERLDNLDRYVLEYKNLLSELEKSQNDLNQGQETGSGASAESAMTESDKKALKYAGEMWNKVTTQEEKDYWHDVAESIRGKYGYSGGESGADYIPTDYIPMYQNGTNYAKGGISLVGENGPELRILNEGDKIIPSDITKNLLNSSKFNNQSLSSSISTITIGTINLPNIFNGEQFVEYLKNNVWRKTLQFQT